jgi:hypothetical protein
MMHRGSVVTEFSGPMEGHEPLMPPGLHHYDLHVWLWKDNPEGIFSRLPTPRSNVRPGDTGSRKRRRRWCTRIVRQFTACRPAAAGLHP